MRADTKCCSVDTNTHTRAQTLASARAKNGIEAPAIRSARSRNFQSAERVYAENDQSDGRDDSLSETILRVELYNKYTYARTPYVNPVTSHTHTHRERESSSSSSVVADKHRTQSSGKVVVHQRRARSECA